MRRTPRTLLLAASLAATGLLVACVPGEAEPTPSATADAPRFASEEEALAAAEEVYGAYLAAVAEVMASGGANPERIEPYVTSDLFEVEADGYRAFQEREWRGVGSYSFTIALQSADLTQGSISTYVCDDRSELDIVDSTGVSVVAPDRPDLAPSTVEFEWDGSLLISSQTAWTGGGVC